MTSKSARRVSVLRYLVSSCAIGYTNRVFAVVAILKAFFTVAPLTDPLLLGPPAARQYAHTAQHKHDDPPNYYHTKSRSLPSSALSGASRILDVL